MRFFDESVALQAWAFCYRSGCVDGRPPAEPPDVGSPEKVVIEFPLKGWAFTASFRPAADECGRMQEVPLESAGDGRFVLRPAGHSAAYDVTLFGRGDGDLSTTFRWTTPIDGALPTPQARLAVIADHDGKPGSYGVKLELTNLARSPRQASASITVQAGNGDGDAVTFHATRSRTRCLPESTVYWDGPDEKGLAAAALGEGPFTYKVELLLDGAVYRATRYLAGRRDRGQRAFGSAPLHPRLPAPLLADSSQARTRGGCDWPGCRNRWRKSGTCRPFYRCRRHAVFTVTRLTLYS